MKDIKGFEGLYAVTSCGKVWSYRSQKFLKPLLDKDGYLRVNLRKNEKLSRFGIHRLVAEAYIPNLEGKPQINHKDEDKTHNYINNLEWVTQAENNKHGTRLGRVGESRKGKSSKVKPIYCVELDRVFESQAQAVRELGVCSTTLNYALNGKRSKSGGYHWQYVIE